MLARVCVVDQRVLCVLAGDCQCMLQWFWLETVSVCFSGFGWRLSVYASVVLAGDCWCILQWCWLETVSECCVVLAGVCVVDQ